MRKPVTIENPILNSPFAEPTRHFRFDAADQITGDIAPGRRESSYRVPAVAAPKKSVKQTLFDDQPGSEVKYLSLQVNQIRAAVKLWRELGRPDTTPTTRMLFDHWTDPTRSRRLFFCQVEALDTLVFITEVAKQSTYGHDWIDAHLRRAAADARTELFRLACKMATGAGKTAVMAMIVAWHTLNKRRNPNDKRFTDLFLVVAPGLTIRDRLRVLQPGSEGDYYRGLDLVPAEHRPDLGTARIVITNFHAFQGRETGDAGGLTKRVLNAASTQAFTESPAEMVARVCRDLGGRREIVVLNDEAHHCYRGKPPAKGDKLTGDDKKEADRRDEEARLWLTGLEAVNAKLGVKAVFDLSATPFYLKGSGHPEGTLFPWVVSDFSLIDAIESGIVKIPRVPVADNAMTGDYPKYRNLWANIREGLPNKGRTADGPADGWTMPSALQGALESLYGHYAARHAEWERDEDGRADGRTPPVFIVVCNNTAVSKLVFDHIAGRDTGHAHPDGAAVVAPGALPIFSNAADNRRLARPNTILIDSAELDTGAELSADFRAAAGEQIREFRADYQARFPGRDGAALTDADILREVMNTVGKPGKLGEQVKCVVSVSMLTEGWDANTVTHILGVRAFGTQLLCEQVVGRGLRRASYALNAEGHFDPEYADVFGVPFAFIPCAGIGETRQPAVTQRPGRVHAVPDRLSARPHLEIAFPRVIGYRYEVPPAALQAEFGPEHRLTLKTSDMPTVTENAPIVGESAELTLDRAKLLRPQEVAYKLAAAVLAKHYPHQIWLLPQLVGIVRRWLDGSVKYGDETFPGLLLFAANTERAGDKIAKAISQASGGADRLRANLPDAGAVGTTAGVSYDTLKPTWKTDPAKSHLNLVPIDSNWEAKVAGRIERMAEVRAYVKNQNLGFRVPYTHDGRPGNYHPDLILKVDDGRGDADLLNLIVEVSGQELAENRGEGRDGQELLGAGGQQREAVRPVGVPGSQRPGLRRAGHSGVPRRSSGWYTIPPNRRRTRRDDYDPHDNI